MVRGCLGVALLLVLLSALAIVGTLHPNGQGHAATAALIAPTLAATLNIAPGVVSDDRSSGRVPWPWLLVAAAAGGLAALLIRKAVRRG